MFESFCLKASLSLLAVGEKQGEGCMTSNSACISSQFNLGIALISPVRSPEVFGSPESSSIVNSIANYKQSMVELHLFFTGSVTEDTTLIVLEVLSGDVSAGNWTFKGNSFLHLVLISFLNIICAKRNIARCFFWVVFTFPLNISEGIVQVGLDSTHISNI